MQFLRIYFECHILKGESLSSDPRFPGKLMGPDHDCRRFGSHPHVIAFRIVLIQERSMGPADLPANRPPGFSRIRPGKESPWRRNSEDSFVNGPGSTVTFYVSESPLLWARGRILAFQFLNNNTILFIVKISRHLSGNFSVISKMILEFYQKESNLWIFSFLAWNMLLL